MSYSLGLIESIEQSPKDISEQDGNVNKQIRDVLNQLETIREKMLYPARFELKERTDIWLFCIIIRDNMFMNFVAKCQAVIMGANSITAYLWHRFCSAG